jgi:polyphosphate kinase
MPRNFFRRVEVMFPVVAPDLARRILTEIIPGYLADNTRARQLDADGVFHRLQPAAGESPVRCQTRFLEPPAGEPDTSAAAPTAAEPEVGRGLRPVGGTRGRTGSGRGRKPRG